MTLIEKLVHFYKIQLQTIYFMFLSILVEYNSENDIQHFSTLFLPPLATLDDISNLDRPLVYSKVLSLSTLACSALQEENQ